jgi:hexosaminidase
MNFLKITIPAILMMLSQLPAAQSLSVIPVPQKAILKEGSFKIGKGTVVISQEKDPFNKFYLVSKLKAIKGFDQNIPSGEVINKINFVYDNTLSKEAYTLSVNPDEVIVKASARAGFFYGIQTILQMLPPTIYSGNVNGFEKWEIPAAEIIDYPRFEYRGMMLDVSRTFFDKETVLKYIDWLSYHKINSFHWHLTDDNGWRIEITKYPLLTEKGAWRGDNEALPPSFGSGKSRYGGYYTQKDIKEIVKYALERNIEIIPEIDLPGHSKAVIVSYPEVLCKTNDKTESVQGEVGNVWCVSNENNYKMLDNIIKELASLFPGKTIHIGGDEVNMSSWENCESCRKLMKDNGMEKPEELLNYFVRRMEKIVEKYGKQMAGWDEILEGGKLHEGTTVYAWRSLEKGEESVNKGQPTVFMPGPFCYFDMKQSPLERGHNWAGIVTTEKTYSLNPDIPKNSENKGYVKGVQGALWTELLGSPQRFLDYQIFPRLAAISEVGWSNQEIRNWSDFSNRLINYHFDRMTNMGIVFRVEPPVVTYSGGIISVNPPYPWAVIRYTDNESEPTAKSRVYSGPIVTLDPLKYRFSNFYNDYTKSIPAKVNNVEYYYQKPEVEVTTSLVQTQRSPLSNITDYKWDTYFRSGAKAKAGDYVLYMFKEPVKSKRITVETGIPDIDFYWVTEGYLEYSSDGVNFERGADLEHGKGIIVTNKEIKAVKINITAPNDGNTLVIQDIKVE